ncbi:MAG: IS481 family transposase [Planctomycetes bacterium]|nr:IS481 family transposase [Planctomycetota bacterium]
MKLHGNARTTVKTRYELVRMVEGGATLGVAADALGVSRHTAAKWVRRYREGGPDGLFDRPSRPKRCPHQTPSRRALEIVALRQRRLTSRQIAHQFGMPHSTVCAVLRRVGLSQLPPLQSPPPVVRYERQAPGDLLHLDTKKLGRISGVGHRIHGDRRRCSRGVGWEFAHVCIDDHSRVAYVEVLPDEKGATTAAFFERALAWFAERGVKTQRVLTDNGSGYLSRDFAAACRDAQVRHLKTRPYTPRTNGKAERLIQTLLREWAYVRPYVSSRRRTAALSAYLRRYNERRPHASLGYAPPVSRLPRWQQPA